MTKKLPIIVITGPTASGKTKLSIDLAQLIDAEIICADSRIVYKDFDIVSAKPSVEERNGIVHHLINIKSPSNHTYSAGDFVEDAKKIIQDLQNRDKNIIISGGTWFYIKSLFDEYALHPIQNNPKLRRELDAYDSEVLWNKLVKLDPKRADEIHKNNKDKIIRALEMIEYLNNNPLTDAKRPLNEKYNTVWFMKDFTVEDKREELYERINHRVDSMINDGLLKEWENNYKKYGLCPVMTNTIGYKEFFDLKDNKYSSFDEAVSKIKQHTRNFAKRQLTYFRNNKNIKKIECIEDIKKYL